MNAPSPDSQQVQRWAAVFAQLSGLFIGVTLGLTADSNALRIAGLVLAGFAVVVLVPRINRKRGSS